MEDLIARTHTLPPELFSQIQTEAFDRPQHPNGGPIAITAAFKYPSQLHINHHYRQVVARKSYTNAWLEFRSQDVFRRFYRNLDDGLLNLVGAVVLISDNGDWFSHRRAALEFGHAAWHRGISFIYTENCVYPGENGCFICEREAEEEDMRIRRHSDDQD